MFNKKYKLQPEFSSCQPLSPKTLGYQTAHRMW